MVLWALDKDGIITLSEGKGLESSGLRPGQVVGRSVFELGRSMPAWLESIRRALSGKEFRETVEVPGATFESLYVPIMGHDGEVDGIIGVALDVTRRHQATRRSWRLHGIQEISSVIGRPLDQFILPEDRDMVKNRVLARQAGKEVPNLNEYRILRANGDVRTAQASATAIIYKGETASLSVLRDVTESKRMEEEARRFTAILEATTDFVGITDPNGHILYINRSGRKMVGLEANEDLKVTLPELHSEWASKILLNEGFPTAVRDGIWSGEVAFLNRDGHEIPVSMLILAHKSPDGDLEYLSTISRDITERKQAEEERARHAIEMEKAFLNLQNAQDQLIQFAKLASLGELVAGVAHELNNPLTAIWGMAQLLMRRSPSDEVRGDLAIIEAEADRSVKIVKNLLSFARRHRPEKRPASINEALQTTLELRSYELKINNINLVTDLQEDLPQTWFDFNQLQQVFLNITINVEQAMSDAHGKGSLTIRTHKVGQSIHVTFADDGPGIPHDIQERIFDPFFTTKEVGKGTGLGLSLCYGIVQEHGGTIVVASEPDLGATFTIQIPVASVEPEEIPAHANSQS